MWRPERLHNELPAFLSAGAMAPLGLPTPVSQ